MIDDDDIGFRSSLVHQSDEAAVILGALRARAQLRSRVDLGPGSAVFRQRGYFGAVPGLSGLLPFLDNLEVGHFLKTAQDRRPLGVVNFLAAGIIRTAFHVANAEW